MTRPLRSRSSEAVGEEPATRTGRCAERECGSSCGLSRSVFFVAVGEKAARFSGTEEGEVLAALKVEKKHDASVV